MTPQPIPEVIGHYRLLELIADRGDTRAYLAEHIRLGRKTFLKIFTGGDPSLIQRFEREARIVAEINHPAVVQIYDFGESQGVYFIAMEYVPGQSLQQYVQQSHPSLAELLNIFYRVASCVAVIHSRGFIHRDLKPENILVAEQGEVKLTDFGLSLHAHRMRVTQEGELLGTPLFMSPEQVNNLPLTPASDVFALGVIFYWLSTGVHPFQSDNVGEVFSRILSVEPEPASHHNPDLPEWFVRLLGKMLEKDPRKRLASAGEVVRWMGPHLGHSPDESQLASPTSRARWSLRFAAAILLLIAGFGGFWLWHHSREALFPTGLPNPAETAAQQQQPGVTEKVPQGAPPASTRPSSGEPPRRVEASRVNPLPSPTRRKLPQTPPSKETGQWATVWIKTWPWCRIYLNYQLVDVTPLLKPLKIKPGRYVLSLQNPRYPSWSDTIEVAAGENRVFTYNLDSLFFPLTLEVVPWGKVFVDDAYIGVTPLNKAIYLTPGRHILRIENKFYRTYLDTLEWYSHRPLHKRVQLMELPLTRNKEGS